MSRAIAPSCPAVGPWLRHAIQLAPPPPPASLVPPGRAHTTRTAHPPPCSRREVAPVQPSLALLPTPCGILAVACLQLVILSPAHALNKRCIIGRCIDADRRFVDDADLNRVSVMQHAQLFQAFDL